MEQQEKLTLDVCPQRLQDTAKGCEAVFAEFGECQPKLRLWNESGHVLNTPASIYFQSQEAKDTLETTLVAAVRGGATAVAVISEVWMVTTTKPDDDSIGMASNGKLHTHPDRVECVSVFYEDESGSYMAFAQIVRPRPNRSATPILTPWEIYHDASGNNSGGRFAGIFKKAGKTQKTT